MAKTNASEKLRELRLQMEQQDAELQSALAGKPVETKLPSNRDAVADPEEGEAEKKALLKRQAAAKATTGWPIWKSVAIGIAVALTAIVLLVVLFSGDSGKQYERPGKFGTASGKRPLNETELQQLYPDDPCPDPWWIPAECKDDKRLKSTTVFEFCNKNFEENGWSYELLKKCGLIT